MYKNKIAELEKIQSEKMKSMNRAEAEKYYSGSQVVIDEYKQKQAEFEGVKSYSAVADKVDQEIEQKKSEELDKSIARKELEYALKAKGLSGSKLANETTLKMNELKSSGDYGASKLTEMIRRI